MANDLSGQIKHYLQGVEEVKNASTGVRKKRQALKPLKEEIISNMKEDNLGRVRVLQYKVDLILQSKQKKKSLTKPHLLTCLKQYEGETLSDELVGNIINTLTLPNEDADVVQTLSVRKIPKRELPQEE